MGKWRWACLSDDGVYRYHLTRQWGKEPSREAIGAFALTDGRIERQAVPYAPRSIGWVMCNPSTADHLRDDPTILKLEKYARLWGYDGIWVTNLWAYRSSDWALLKRLGQQGLDIIGPGNDQALGLMLKHTQLTLLAWGNIATKIPGHRDRVDTLKKLARNTPNTRLGYLKLTAANAPSHPLYLPDAIYPKKITIG